MSNGSEACCAVGSCCPGMPERKAALTKILVDNSNGALMERQAEVAADIVLSGFALAPKTLEPFVAEILAMRDAHGH